MSFAINVTIHGSRIHADDVVALIRTIADGERQDQERAERVHSIALELAEARRLHGNLERSLARLESVSPTYDRIEDGRCALAHARERVAQLEADLAAAVAAL